MPYTQTFGFSRTSSVVGGNALSPLNKFSDEVVKEKKELAPEVDISSDTDKDIIIQNNDIANEKTDNYKEIITAAIKKNTGGETVVSKPTSTIGGSEWEKRQKEVFEEDSAWTQLGTLLSNPFQGASAFMQQWRRGAQRLIGNDSSASGPGSSLTNLRRAKKAQSLGAEGINIRGDLFNSASQWIAPAILASSVHQGITGTGQIATGNIGKGSATIAGGLYAYVPGLNKIKGGKTWLSKASGNSPKIQNFLNRGVEKVSKTNLGKKTWSFADKGGTYSYKLNKGIEQSS